MLPLTPPPSSIATLKNLSEKFASQLGIVQLNANVKKQINQIIELVDSHLPMQKGNASKQLEKIFFSASIETIKQMKREEKGIISTEVTFAEIIKKTKFYYALNAKLENNLFKDKIFGFLLLRFNSEVNKQIEALINEFLLTLKKDRHCSELDIEKANQLAKEAFVLTMGRITQKLLVEDANLLPQTLSFMSLTEHTAFLPTLKDYFKEHEELYQVILAVFQKGSTINLRRLTGNYQQLLSLDDSFLSEEAQNPIRRHLSETLLTPSANSKDEKRNSDEWVSPKRKHPEHALQEHVSNLNGIMLCLNPDEKKEMKTLHFSTLSNIEKLIQAQQKRRAEAYERHFQQVLQKDFFLSQLEAQVNDQSDQTIDSLLQDAFRQQITLFLSQVNDQKFKDNLDKYLACLEDIFVSHFHDVLDPLLKEENVDNQALTSHLEAYLNTFPTCFKTRFRDQTRAFLDDWSSSSTALYRKQNGLNRKIIHDIALKRQFE
ncbi:hypothetical protein [Candidatus Protochlamydia phocaeensis]|uniref:hypothetical protein n=1 Tax=Candidatus Protochlamydia phocaeensis TaxID=1414722 RepID=UPI00083886CB|nr:hypothetical protein [Candidatus Protochlamydia phocaeensis]